MTTQAGKTHVGIGILAAAALVLTALAVPAAARADGNPQRHLSLARRGLGGHEVGDVPAGNQQHQPRQRAQCNQRRSVHSLISR